MVVVTVQGRFAATVPSCFDEPHLQLVLAAGELGVSKLKRAADIPGGAANVDVLSVAYRVPRNKLSASFDTL